MVEVTVLTEPQLHPEVVEEVVDQEEVEVEVVVDQIILDQQHLILDIIGQEFQGELLEEIGEVVVEEGVEEGVVEVEVVEILQVEDLHQEDLEAAALPPVEMSQMLASGPTTS
jgi:hypothetical protein